jgi:hypothetical protein
VTKADLLRVIADLPDDAETWIETETECDPVEVLLRPAEKEIRLGGAATLRDTLKAWNETNPEHIPDILWYNPGSIPAAPADLASIAVATMKTQY